MSDDVERFASEGEACEEAKRRNLEEGRRLAGIWWIETELPSGEWSVQRLSLIHI